jgi:hypothetical protein
MDITAFINDDLGPLNVGRNRSVAFYIMAAYAYYIEDDPLFTDEVFDSLAKYILKEWDNITHPHLSYLTKDMLEAGTYLGDYPSMAIGGLEDYRKKVLKNKKASL